MFFPVLALFSACTSTQVHTTSAIVQTPLSGVISGLPAPQLTLKGRVIRSVSCYRQLDDLQVHLRGPASGDSPIIIGVEANGDFSYINEVPRGKYTISLNDVRSPRVLAVEDFQMTPQQDRFEFRFNACP